MHKLVWHAAIAALGFVPAIAWADTVELDNGDLLTGKVVEQTEHHVVLTHPVLGKVTVPKDQVAAVKLSAPDAPADQPTQEAKIEEAKTTLSGAGYTVEPPKGEEPPNPGLKIGPVSLFEGWDRRFEVGLNGSEGNTQEFNARVALGGHYEDIERRWFADMVYYTSRADHDTTDNNFYAQVTRDWLLTGKKHFYFATGRYDWDDFEEWTHRLSGGGGIGYEFVKNDDWSLLGRAGLAGKYDFNGPKKGFTPEGLLGVDLRWDITDGQRFTFSNTYYPDLSNLHNFRNMTKVEWSIDVGSVENMALKVGAENEHESDPAGEDKKNDLTYYLALVWDF